jgi:hypothetical protein
MVNSQLHLEVLARSRDAVRWSRPELWGENQNWSPRSEWLKSGSDYMSMDCDTHDKLVSEYLYIYIYIYIYIYTWCV